MLRPMRISMILSENIIQMRGGMHYLSVDVKGCDHHPAGVVICRAVDISLEISFVDGVFSPEGSSRIFQEEGVFIEDKDHYERI